MCYVAMFSTLCSNQYLELRLIRHLPTEYSTPVSVGFGSSLARFLNASCRCYAVGGSCRGSGRCEAHGSLCEVRRRRNANCYGLQYKICTLSVWSMNRDAVYTAPVRGCSVVSVSSVGTENPGTVTERGVRSSCFLTTLPTTGIIQRRWHMSESVWIIGGMIMIGESQSTERKTLVTVNLSTMKATWAGRELNLDPRSESMATKQACVPCPGLWLSCSVVYSHLQTNNEYFAITLKGNNHHRWPRTGNKLKINGRILSKIFNEIWPCRYPFTHAMCIFHETCSLKAFSL